MKIKSILAVLFGMLLVASIGFARRPVVDTPSVDVDVVDDADAADDAAEAAAEAAEAAAEAEADAAEAAAEAEADAAEAAAEAEADAAEAEAEAAEGADEDPGSEGRKEKAERTLNDTLMAKIQRLSEATGVSADEIVSLRLSKGPEGSKKGFGGIAKRNGAQRGVLGQGTGDKFMPVDETGEGEGGAEDPEVELPELTDPPEEASDAVTGAQDDALDRAGKALGFKKDGETRGKKKNTDDLADAADEGIGKGKEARGKAHDTVGKGRAKKADRTGGRGNGKNK